MKNKLSIYISLLLRHQPEKAHLTMDTHGWVSTDQLIQGINQYSKYTIDLPTLEELVKNDEKGRYKFNYNHSKIKACQGHSIPWVEPELTYVAPPDYLFHGTTSPAKELIYQSGYISKMERHAVHMQQDMEMASKSARRWHQTPVVLKIDARKMEKDGYKIGVTDNNVWCTEKVPVEYIVDTIYI